MTIPTTTSGCKAMENCERKSHCLRYQIYQKQTAYRGWSSWQMCLVSEFVVNTYPHFIEVDVETSNESSD